MGVGLSVTMAGKMFAATDDPFGLHCRQKRPARVKHRLWIGAKSAFADHRIFWIGMNIEHRREIEVDAKRGEFAPHCVTHLLSRWSPACRIRTPGDRWRCRA